MLKRKQHVAFAVCCLAIAALTGCGPTDGKVEVTGVVLVDGEPLPGASLAFIGGGGGIFGTGSTDEAGKFTIRAAPGSNEVSVSAYDTTGAADAAEMDEEDQLMGSEEDIAGVQMPNPLVAQKYFNASTSGISINVEQGMEPVTIEVTSE